MENSIIENTNLTFINLKEYLTEYFTKHPFIFICDNPELILANNKFNGGIVSLTNEALEKNIRFEDSCYPEYLFTFLVNSERTSLIENIKNLKPKLKSISYHQGLFEYKLKQLFEIILYKDFYNSNWPSSWIKDRCYVVKVNNQLEYYTIWDYLKLLSNLLDWVIITYQTVDINRKKGYKLILDFNPTI